MAKKETAELSKLIISDGLECMGEGWELLVPMFEQFQIVSAELANPGLDLLTFTHAAHYFGVLRLVRDEEAEEALLKDAQKIVPENMPEDVNGSGPFSNVNGVGSGSGGAWEYNSTYDEMEHTGFDIKPEELDEDALQENLWRQKNWKPKLIFDDLVSPTPRPSFGFIGMVYLTSSQNMEDYLRSGELSIGVYIDPHYRNMGYARQAIQKTLKVAFDDKNCQRVQAVLVDNPWKDRALSLFMKSGLGHEGVRRRGFRSPYDYEFKDVTYLGLLATDWFMRSTSNRKWVLAPKSLWDELLSRHQREREELLRWEAKQLKRSSSMETIRQDLATDDSADADDMYELEELGSSGPDANAHSVSSEGAASRSSSQAPPCSVKRRKPSDVDDHDHNAAATENGSFDDLLSQLQYSQDNGRDIDLTDGALSGRMDWLAESTTRAVHRGESPGFSDDDSDIETEFSDGDATSTSSQWDVVDLGSSSGFSEVDYDTLNLDAFKQT